jgi:GDP-4-dehydro-6-deoxy-D-mannose reductase
MPAPATLVTGAAGFVGRWLLPALIASGRRPFGLRRPAEPAGSPQAEWLTADLCDAAAVAAAVRRAHPQEVVHLAAVASPAQAARAPLEALRTNYLGTDHLVAALQAHAPRARLLYVSSGEVYGFQPRGAAPHTESSPLRPHTAYAGTRAAAEQRVALAAEREGLDAVIARPFNHTGPGRSELYAESTFARQLAAIERGAAPAVLQVGNLETLRDFSDVRDVCSAYLLLLERGARGGAYNVASGRSRELSSVLERLLACSSARPQVRIDPGRYRRVDPDQLQLAGDASALRALGWRPARDVDATLAELLQDWRERR